MTKKSGKKNQGKQHGSGLTGGGNGTVGLVKKAEGLERRTTIDVPRYSARKK